MASHLLTGGEGVAFTFHHSPGGFPALEQVVWCKVEGPGEGDVEGEEEAEGEGEGEGGAGGAGGTVSEDKVSKISWFGRGVK
jgi:hypothetical protein